MYSSTDGGQLCYTIETAISSNSDPHPPFEYSGHLRPEGEGRQSSGARRDVSSPMIATKIVAPMIDQTIGNC